MTAQLTIKSLDESRPHQLFEQYAGQTKPQRAYIALDLRDGTMTAGYNPEIGNAIPMDVWQGLIRRWYMPPFAAETANRIMQDMAELAQRVLDGAEILWDGNGSNMIGRLTDDAQAAVKEIGQELDLSAVDDEDDICFDPMLGGDWFGDALRQDVRATTTDADLEQMVDDAIYETRQNAPAAVINRDEVLELYKEHRDGLHMAAGDIAAWRGLSVQTVHQWAKRYPGFRALAEETSAGLIWYRRDVERWLSETGRA